MGGMVDGVAEQGSGAVDPGGWPDPGDAVGHLDLPAAAAGLAGGGGDLDVVTETEQAEVVQAGGVAVVPVGGVAALPVLRSRQLLVVSPALWCRSVLPGLPAEPFLHRREEVEPDRKRSGGVATQLVGEVEGVGGGEVLDPDAD